MSKNLRRIGVVAAAVCAGVLAWAAPAFAHVTVNPSEAPKEGYATLTFRVPSEKESATVKVEVVFDEKAPITSARTKPIPGWTAEVKTRTLDKPIKDSHGEERTEAVESITWTADPGNGINADQFQEFDASVGPLPDADEVVFKALQYYEGEAEPVRWIDTGEDAANPAPVLTLTKATDDHHGGSGDASSDDHAEVNDDEAKTAKNIGIAGLVVGGLGLLIGIAALVRSGKATATKTSGE